ESSNNVLEIKSHTLTVPVLLLHGNDLAAIGEQLRLKVEQATDFFRHSALLVDLHQLNRDDLPLDLKPLLKLLRDREFLPIGVRGASDEQAAQARALGLSVHTFGAAMTQVERLAAQK